MHKIHSKLVRETFGVKDSASYKVVEKRLNWYAYIERQGRKHILQKVKDLRWLANGERVDPRGLRDCMKMDMEKFVLALEIAQDHAIWKQRIASRVTGAAGIS